MGEQDELRFKIDTLHNRLNEFYALDDSWRTLGEWPEGVTGSVLHPPASSDEIAKAEARFGHKFPPSYKEFLRLQSAWEHFWGDNTLIGTGRPATQRAQDKIAEYIGFQRDSLRRQLGADLSPEAITAWESKEPRNLCLANQLIIGTDFSGALWAYDTRTRRENGEMTLVFWELSYGAQDPTFERFFPDFLDFVIGEVDFRIEHLKAEEQNDSQ